jgi:hypothetical protein
MTARQTRILQLLVEEYSNSGHEVTEHHGQQFARITWPNGDGVDMTDVCLTRLAEQIESGLERRAI